MVSALKAEVRKLLTTRSTYIIVGLCLLLDLFLTGFVKGYKLAGGVSPITLQDSATTAVMLTAVISSLVGILLVTHEYRYNTILYSLTANKSRTTLLVAKILTISAFSLLLAAVVFVLAPLFTLAGLHIGGHSLPAQTIAYGDVIWRALFYAWGYAMIGLLLAALIRSQIGAIMTFFIVPTTVEGLLSILLKNNTSYLPFSALGAVLNQSIVLSYRQAAVVVLIYLIVGWIIAWLLFMRRDAN